MDMKERIQLLEEIKEKIKGIGQNELSPKS